MSPPGSPAQALVEHAAQAALVVVGRHHRRHAVGATLGRTVRELLRHCAVPVMVVDPLVGDEPARGRHDSASTSSARS